MTRGGFVQPEMRRGFWRAEIGEAQVGKGPAHHFRYFTVFGKKGGSILFTTHLL